MGEHGYSLLESALQQAFIYVGEEEIYKTPFEKAVRILVGIIKNHPFTDGNKRTAFALCKEILREHGYTLTGYSVDEMADFLEYVASSRLSIDELYKFSKEFLLKFLIELE